jgi:hypothetical protein
VDFPPTFVNKTYFAQTTDTGLGTWKEGADYPVSLSHASCVSATTYVYCIGGFYPPEALSESYFSSLSSSGMGPWVKTTSYPMALARIMCVTSSGFVYCVGGSKSAFDPSGGVNSSYYAQLSSSGIGPWMPTNPIPLTGHQAAAIPCVPQGGYIYCEGAGGTFYAPLTSSG